MRDIPSYPNYQIGESGVVKNKYTGVIMKQTSQKSGNCVYLTNCGKTTKVSIISLLKETYQLQTHDGDLEAGFQTTSLNVS